MCATTRREAGRSFDHGTMPLYPNFEKEWIDQQQPMRTDCAFMMSEAAFVDVEIGG